MTNRKFIVNLYANVKSNFPAVIVLIGYIRSRYFYSIFYKFLIKVKSQFYDLIFAFKIKYFNNHSSHPSF